MATTGMKFQSKHGLIENFDSVTQSHMHTTSNTINTIGEKEGVIETLIRSPVSVQMLTGWYGA